ncbi:MAG: tetratricopeptide repeat protein [Ardenticatenaceae bacterium]|nr:tetratricopeptide repeat protein [Ardenticatenaceae bacterium]
MATIILREYLDQINQLIEEGRYSEASQHCHYILQAHPRHIDTYRALAKSLLEQRQYKDARDIFQRVLSADPSDFIAHVGLAFINRDEGQLEQAVWHMERAYEVEPHNAAIQEELLELYRAHHGQRPQKLSLTGASLAWLYFRGELYQLAVTELRKILQERADRIDLKVLLAEALWRDGQRMDAVNVCLQVLDKLPNCVQVNAILAEIWLLTGRIDEAQTYLQRLQDLTLVNQADYDPETAVFRAFTLVGAPDLPETMTIEYFDETVSVAQNGKGKVDWLDEADTVLEGGEYSWLQDLGTGTDELEETDQEISEAEWAESSTSSGLLESDWFGEETISSATQTSYEDEGVDWLQDMAMSEQDGDVVVDEAGEPISTPSGIVAGMANWLDADTEEDGVPDWLAGSSDAEYEPIHLNPADTADWLADLADEEADEPDDSGVSTGHTDWFTDPVQQTDELSAARPVESDWFKEPEDVASSAADSSAAADEMDWLAETDTDLEPMYLNSMEFAALGNDLAAFSAEDDDEEDELEAAFAEPEPEQGQEPGAAWSPDAIPDWLMTAPLQAAANPPAAPKMDVEDDEIEWGGGLADWLSDEVASDAALEVQDEELPSGVDLEELLDAPELATGLLADESDGESVPTWLLSGESELEDVMAPDEPDDDTLVDDLFGDFGSFMDDEEEETAVDLFADDDMELADSGELDLSLLSSRPELASTDGFATEEDDLSDWMTGDTYESLEAQLAGEMESPSDDFMMPDWVDEEAADEPIFETDFAAEEPEPEEAPPVIERSSGLLDWLQNTAFSDTGDMEAAVTGDMDKKDKDLEIPEDDAAQEPDEQEDALDWLADLTDQSPPMDDLFASDLAAPEAEAAGLPDWLDDLSTDHAATESEIEESGLTDLLGTQTLVEQPTAAVTELLDWLDGDAADTPDMDAVPDEADEILAGLDADDEMLDDSSLMWLEELSLEAEDVPAPDFLDDVVLEDETVPETAVPATDDAISWLDDLGEEELPEAETVMDLAEVAAMDEEIDLDGADDDAMSWLMDLDTEDVALDSEAMPAFAAAEDETDEAIAWLDDMTAEAEDELAMPVVAADAGLFAFAEEEPAAEQDETVQDWLDDLVSVDETESDLETRYAAEVEPAAETDMLALDDFFGGAADDEDVESWLDDLARETEEEEAEAELVMESAPLLDDMFADDTVEAWPEAAEAETEPAAETEFERVALLSDLDISVGEEDTAVSDWLDDLALDGEIELPDLEMEEFTLDDLLAEAAEPAEMAAEAETVDWLDDFEQEEPDLFAPEAELPGESDWLTEVISDEVEETAVDELAEFEETAVAPVAFDDDTATFDWLEDLAQEEPELAAEPLEEAEAELEMVDFALPELDLEAEADGETGALDWLGDLAQEEPELTAEPFEEVEAEPEMADFALPELDMEAEADGETGALDWLGDLAQEEPELFAEPFEEVEAEPEMADFALPELDMEAEADGETGALDWLDDLAQEAPELAAEPLEEVEAEPEMADFVEPDLPADEGEDVMAWLDSLGASDEDVALDEAETAVSMPLDEVDEDEPADAMAWLETMAAEIDEEPEETTFAAEPELDSGIVFPEDAMFPRDVGEPTDVPDELDDTMAWIEQLAAEQGVTLDLSTETGAAAPVEVAEVVEEEVAAVEEIPTPAPAVEEVDDPMAWLEQLASEQSTPIEALPTVADRALPETVVPPELTKPASVAEFADEDAEPAAEPDESVESWLADLMADQGVVDDFTAAEEETAEPAVPEPPALPAEPEPQPELEPVDEIAADLDWLEMLAATSTPSLDTLLAETKPVTDPAASDLFAALDWVENQLTKAPDSVPTSAPAVDDDIDLSQIPEDPEETLAWLEQMSEPDEDVLVAEMETAVSPQPPVISEGESDFSLAMCPKTRTRLLPG